MLFRTSNPETHLPRFSANQHRLPLKSKSVMPDPLRRNPPGCEFHIICFLLNLPQRSRHGIRQTASSSGSLTLNSNTKAGSAQPEPDLWCSFIYLRNRWMDSSCPCNDALTSPPWSSTMRFTMASPSPELCGVLLARSPQ